MTVGLNLDFGSRGGRSRIASSHSANSRPQEYSFASALKTRRPSRRKGAGQKTGVIDFIQSKTGHVAHTQPSSSTLTSSAHRSPFAPRGSEKSNSISPPRWSRPNSRGSSASREGAFVKGYVSEWEANCADKPREGA